MRELRHDFRRVYGVSYDEVPTDEAIDLVLTLPPGSLYVRVTRPQDSWPEWRHAAADIQDELWRIAYAQAGVKSNPPQTFRPADIVENARARASVRKAVDVIGSTEWEEV
ncbi:hypothetical protein [Adlercreutzia sp. ZJ141]|uniref:hypothetical protein n=1 Tax=Adlercreutzia sp. ZJ141 TaxID=2709406 RepID=UPI0013EA7B0C|nr:hypothetical protein [Adlercreutzia sp. ZJ141]